MALRELIEPGIQLYDRRTGRNYFVAACEKHPSGARTP
jgi:hypothetical protein